MPRPLTIFISYAHEDRQYMAQLEQHLKGLERDSIVAVWYDEKIAPGDEWKGQIEQHLNRSDVILLLVSSSFIASDFCWNKELTRALQRHARGDVKVIPVIVRDCDWHDLPFGKLHALPDNGKPVSRWTQSDEPLTQVAKAIRQFAISHRLENVQASEKPSAGVTTANATETIQLRIEADLDSFSNQDRQRLLAAIENLLETNENVKITRIRKGSVKVEIQLTREQADRLYWAVKSGGLQEVGVTDAEFVYQVELQLSSDQAGRLQSAVNRGEFQEFGVTDAELIEESRSEGDFNALLRSAQQGEREAEQQFCELINDELRRRARALVRGGSDRATSLVNEVFLRLFRTGGLRTPRNETYFYAVAVDQMRQILRDRIRSRAAQKKGGAHKPRPLDVALDGYLDAFQEDNSFDFEALDQALQRLKQGSATQRQYEVVKLRFFAGLTIKRTAEIMGLSERVVASEWKLARAKLYSELKEGT